MFKYNVNRRWKQTHTLYIVKGITSIHGMSKPRMFQVMDPNATQQCTLVTFQKEDCHFINSLSDKLPQILTSIIGKDQIEKIYQGPNIGICFSNATAKSKGKYIKIQDQSKEQLDFLDKANSLLSSPPKNDPIKIFLIHYPNRI
jgi:hypothetical protein